ncbi:MAG: Rrf2 family transcriptional regulator [Chloroflexi bacterium]|nr:Rrf2 family transcriptional regulator [Chloroflexota bacterium]
MQLSRKADYGIRVMLEVAASAVGSTPVARQVARRQIVPNPFLRKIVSQLSAAGLLETRRGRRGGLKLARPPESITLRQVVEALEGPIVLNWCLARPGLCSLDETCPAYVVWGRAQEALMSVLDSATLAQLMVDKQQLLASLQRQGASPETGRPDGNGNSTQPA